MEGLYPHEIKGGGRRAHNYRVRSGVSGCCVLRCAGSRSKTTTSRVRISHNDRQPSTKEEGASPPPYNAQQLVPRPRHNTQQTKEAEARRGHATWRADVYLVVILHVYVSIQRRASHPGYLPTLQYIYSEWQQRYRPEPRKSSRNPSISLHQFGPKTYFHNLRTRTLDDHLTLAFCWSVFSKSFSRMSSPRFMISLIFSDLSALSCDVEK